jgi:hypothetical protein
MGVWRRSRYSVVLAVPALEPEGIEVWRGRLSLQAREVAFGARLGSESAKLWVTVPLSLVCTKRSLTYKRRAYGRGISLPIDTPFCNLLS